MIRNEAEYKEAVKRINDEKDRLAEQRKALHAMGLTAAQVKRATDPIRSFHLQLAEEVVSYERLKRGEFEEVLNLRGFGPLLISLRIARGMTQRELAEALGVNESQVSRDERNEYHGITLERAAKILEALRFELRTRIRDEAGARSA
jgi:DNA-binding XRE family transcriptional regulator